MLRPRVRRNNVHGSSLELKAGSCVDTGFLMLRALPANSPSGVECTEKGDGIYYQDKHDQGQGRWMLPRAMELTLVENKIEGHEIEAPWKNVILETQIPVRVREDWRRLWNSPRGESVN